MSRDFSPENGFPNSLGLSYITVSPQNLRDFDARADLRRIFTKELDSNQSVALPYRPKNLREEVPELLQQLHSFNPLCCSGNQRELARKALTALKNRKQEDISNLAKNLANDVASAVD
jgi:hypothetical protein